MVQIDLVKMGAGCKSNQMWKEKIFFKVLYRLTGLISLVIKRNKWHEYPFHAREREREKERESVTPATCKVEVCYGSMRCDFNSPHHTLQWGPYTPLCVRVGPTHTCTHTDTQTHSHTPTHNWPESG